MADQRKDVRSSKLLSGVKIIQEQFKRLLEQASGEGDPWKQYPQFMTGARAYVTVAGKPYAVAMRVQYRCSMEVEEVRSVDANLPWDMVPGQVHVSAMLQGLIDPTEPAEVDGLWSTMASIVHQPMVEIEVMDKLGEKLFWARGAFTDVSDVIASGALSERTASFRGLAFAHNCAQSFVPYRADSAMQNALKSASSSLKSLTGGLF